MKKVTEEEVSRFMAVVEHHTKQALHKIKQLDQEVTIKQARYLCLASSINDQSNSLQSLSSSLRASAIQEAEALAEQIKGKLKEKVTISQKLYCKLADWYEEFDQFLETDLGKGDGSGGLLVEWLGSEETSGIMLQLQKKEMQDMCICRARQQSTQMIKCDQEYCKKRWFHLKCMKIRPHCIPEGNWTCPDCTRAKKVTVIK